FDEDATRFQLHRKALLLLTVPGPGGGRETVSAAVGDTDGVLQVVRAECGRQGPEELLGRHRRVFGRVRQNGGREVAIAGRVWLTAGEHACASLHAAAHLLRQLLDDACGGEWSQLRGFVHRVAHTQCTHGRYEALHERIVHIRMHD